ncbi:hypothetical protein [Mycolicibacterium komossense]|uniref:Bacteriophage protein n=1 Tax=Mycolicibacterium komossense TaxID=1779 RepID=A0ABT3CMQ0_9MYCO|nr:hypothetical protein [Mycolicibacterium komossense]MCV7230704.1 hypothetical protein [Mycolicibacterium komossense]
MNNIQESERRRIRLNAVETALRIHQDAKHAAGDGVLDTAAKITTFIEREVDTIDGNPQQDAEAMQPDPPEPVTPIYIGCVVYHPDQSDPSRGTYVRQDAEGKELDYWRAGAPFLPHPSSAPYFIDTKGTR